jgi:hypothetical protein
MCVLPGQCTAISTQYRQSASGRTAANAIVDLGSYLHVLPQNLFA